MITAETRVRIAVPEGTAFARLYNGKIGVVERVYDFFGMPSAVVCLHPSKPRQCVGLGDIVEEAA
jgi:hypothetical protein